MFCVALNAEALRAVCDRDNVKDMVACEEKGLGRLMWQDGADIFEGDWDEAKRYCENLNFAGYLDWRLPTSLELLSITDDSRFDPAINRAFKNFVSRSYWSSIKSAGFSSSAWFVDFRDGRADCDAVSIRRFVRCVRDY